MFRTRFRPAVAGLVLTDPARTPMSFKGSPKRAA